MMNKEILISSLINAKICQVSDIRGASLEDVATLETVVGQNMPAQYREFLLAIGHGAGEFFQGTDIFLSALDGLKDEAIGLLRENDEDVTLTDDAFVFSMHQGYEFAYFNMADGGDPPVYQYVEGNGSPVLTWSSFSEFLNDSIARHAQLKVQ
jgi:SMI1-KNR4 cell-wall